LRFGFEQWTSDFTRKVVIVTGATANIGRAIALEFASAHACLVAGGRTGQVWSVTAVRCCEWRAKCWLSALSC
jgi:NAD(P)-dependent dehydrogenase (short-subunit alcohol dehydrogenase family)